MEAMENEINPAKKSKKKKKKNSGKLVGKNKVSKLLKDYRKKI